MIDVRIKLGFDGEQSDMVITDADTGDILKQVTLKGANDYCMEMEKAHSRYNVIEEL